MSLHHRLAPVLLATALAACSAPAPLATPADIASADATGTLPTLYNQVKSQLANRSRGDKKYAAQFAQLDGIGRTLTNRLDDDLRKRLESGRLGNGLVPQKLLTELRADAEPMRQWQPPRLDQYLREIDKHQAATGKAIDSINSYMAGLAVTEFRKKQGALTQLALVTGEDKYNQQRDAMVQGLRGEFEQARATDNFERALLLLDALPADAGTETTRVELQAQLAERRFNESLADDRPDEAYRWFDSLSKSSRFVVVKARITPTANTMADYFVALAADAVAAGRTADAYRWFAQARDVHFKLDGRSNAVPEERPFVDRVYRGHDRAKAEGLWGLALGHLLIAQEFDPARQGIATDLRAANEQTGAMAIRSAGIAPFGNASGSVDYSGAVATNITGYLFKSIPNDVRIIAGAGNGGIDYSITGSVDEARVETNENPTRKSERVLVEKNAISRNPRYDDWLKLSERERKRIPQPAPQLAADRYEDISYNVTELRKVGYVSVAFRIIEAASGKVVYTDKVTVKKEFADQGNEGVARGSYNLPARTPKLPSDIEILNQLAGEASADIGKRLATQLGNLEQRYAEAGKRSAAANNPVEAAQYYALAVAVAQRKGIDPTAWALELKRQSAASNYAR